MNNRDFKGIWIPKEIWLSEELTMQEKLFLVEIDSLDNQQGCFANNQYFSDFFGISTVRVSKVINSLVEKGFITSIINQSKGNKRVLRVTNKSFRPSQTKVNEGSQTKVNEGHKQKLIHNNTVNNTKSNTRSKEEKDSPLSEYDSWLRLKENRAMKNEDWFIFLEKYEAIKKIAPELPEHRHIATEVCKKIINQYRVNNKGDWYKNKEDRHKVINQFLKGYGKLRLEDEWLFDQDLNYLNKSFEKYALKIRKLQ